MVPFILTVCVDPVGSDFALNTLHLFNNKEFPIRWSIIHLYMTIEEKNCFAKQIFCCVAFLVIHFSPQVCRHFCHNWLRISGSHILPCQIFTSERGEVAGQCSGNLHLGGNLYLCASFTLVASFTFVTTFTMEGKWQADQLKLELTAEGEGV